MIYDYSSLKNKYKEYSNVNQKIALEARNHNFERIKKSLYSDDIDKDYLVLANICDGPSYISFEYALSYYGLIPEHVSHITSATFNKKENKTYEAGKYSFDYKNIPTKAYFYGITYLKNENNINYKIATKEKALCDLLYIKYPVRSIKDLKILLYDDLRIDKEEFEKLDLKSISELTKLYPSNTLKVLNKYINEEYLNEYHS